MSSYEDTVMLPVAKYLDVCATSTSTPSSNADADADATTTATVIEAIDSITSSLDCATADNGGDAFGHWDQFLRGGGDDDGGGVVVRRFKFGTSCSRRWLHLVPNMTTAAAAARQQQQQRQQ